MPSSIPIIRALTQDNGSPPIMTDPDLQVIVDLEPNAFRAAAAAARAIAGKFSDRVDMDAGSSSVDLSKQAENYLKLAESFDKRAQQGGDGGTGMSGTVAGQGALVTGTSNSEIDAVRDDEDRYDSVFYRGLDNNPPGFDPDSDEGYR